MIKDVYDSIFKLKSNFVITTKTDSDGWVWTIPKIIGVAAGGLVLIAIIAAVVQVYKYKK